MVDTAPRCSSSSIAEWRSCGCRSVQRTFFTTSMLPASARGAATAAASSTASHASSATEARSSAYSVRLNWPKTQALFRLLTAVFQHCEYYLKCDTDTFLNVSRL